jgi:transposase
MAGAAGQGLCVPSDLHRRDMGKDEHDPPAWPLRQRPAPGRHGQRKTLTFVAGLRCDGITAPCILDGPINAESFLAWVVQFLVPTLRPGDIVVMDNLSSHKDLAIRRAIRAAGAKLFYLPPYSPDLNPIEQAFAKLKALLQKSNARNTSRSNPVLSICLNKTPPRSVATASPRQGSRADGSTSGLNLALLYIPLTGT